MCAFGFGIARFCRGIASFGCQTCLFEDVGIILADFKGVAIAGCAIVTDPGFFCLANIGRAAGFAFGAGCVASFFGFPCIAFTNHDTFFGARAFGGTFGTNLGIACAVAGVAKIGGTACFARFPGIVFANHELGAIAFVVVFGADFGDARCRCAGLFAEFCALACGFCFKSIILTDIYGIAIAAFFASFTNDIDAFIGGTVAHLVGAARFVDNPCIVGAFFNVILVAPFFAFFAHGNDAAFGTIAVFVAGACRGGVSIIFACLKRFIICAMFVAVIADVSFADGIAIAHNAVFAAAVCCNFCAVDA